LPDRRLRVVLTLRTAARRDIGPPDHALRWPSTDTANKTNRNTMSPGQPHLPHRPLPTASQVRVAGLGDLLPQLSSMTADKIKCTPSAVVRPPSWRAAFLRATVLLTVDYVAWLGNCGLWQPVRLPCNLMNLR